MAKRELHYHGCTKCRERYPDACDDRTVTAKGICPSCQQGRRSMLMTGIEPRDCCRENSRAANKHDLKTYRLAGRTWWLCAKCARQFPVDPQDPPCLSRPTSTPTSRS